jgi:hypothetical protein
VSADEWRREQRRLMVKQYVAEVQGRFGWFQVFETGDAKYYLFVAVVGESRVATGLSFPVEKKRLTQPLRRALANGVGHARPDPTVVRERRQTHGQREYGEWGLV